MRFGRREIVMHWRRRRGFVRIERNGIVIRVIGARWGWICWYSAKSLCFQEDFGV